MVSSHESPTHKDLLDEVKFLRTQNKVLKAAINAVKDTATEKLTKSYELNYLCKHTANSWEYFVPSFIARFPTHPASKWLDHSEKHKDEIDKLHSMDGDFHHGFNSGVLAAARMFKDHTEIDLESAEASSAAKVVIEGSKKSFPDLSCNKFPVVNEREREHSSTRVCPGARLT
eukprot:scaffold12414_cov84-Cyclotella_meneghiniana.AAC.9